MTVVINKGESQFTNLMLEPYALGVASLGLISVLGFGCWRRYGQAVVAKATVLPVSNALHVEGSENGPLEVDNSWFDTLLSDYYVRPDLVIALQNPDTGVGIESLTPERVQAFNYPHDGVMSTWLRTGREFSAYGREYISYTFDPCYENFAESDLDFDGLQVWVQSYPLDLEGYDLAAGELPHTVFTATTEHLTTWHLEGGFMSEAGVFHHVYGTPVAELMNHPTVLHAITYSDVYGWGVDLTLNVSLLGF
jgi:hypothetical protein